MILVEGRESRKIVCDERAIEPERAKREQRDEREYFEIETNGLTRTSESWA